jgi:4-amino-4-deoxy-L-arabinose transferase-like glycosyltransferase
VVLLWLASLVLLFTHLGALPLRDWDESLVARVAEEISLRPFPQNLLPTLWGDPYLNKPPLLHGLIAAVIGLWRSGSGAEMARQLPPEWLVRSVPAACSSLIVPLVAMVQWRLRPGDRLAAVCSAAVALTLLPLMRHGRLAMLDGSLISAMALQWWALLSLPRQPGPRSQCRWGVIAGLAGSAILLLKAPASLPLLLGACGLLALEQRWRLRHWLPLLGWIAVGLLPGLLWHGWHLLERGPEALTMWGGQGMARVVSELEGHSGGLLVPVLEVLEGGWPWLALWPLAMLRAVDQRRERWGFWSLGFTVLTAAAVLPLRTQLPWYSHLLWPSFVLVVAPLLAELIQRQADQRLWWTRCLRWVPGFWFLGGASILVMQGQLGVPAMIAIPAALALLVGGWLLMARELRFRRLGAMALVVLLWWALLNLFASRLWLWELQETWAVKPVAASIKLISQKPQPLRVLWLGDERPSLDWYLGQELITGRPARRELHRGDHELLVLSFNEPSTAASQCAHLLKASQQQTAVPDLYRCHRR